MNRDAIKWAEKAKEFETGIGYTFNNRLYLVEALTHSSYAHEQSLSYSNERFELLGDAVYHLVVTEFLMHRYRHDSEGQLSALRSYCENEYFLYMAALDIHLGEYLFLGKGERNAGGYKKQSVLSDSYEALVAAIYLDGGYQAVSELILRQLSQRIIEAHDKLLYLDSKSELQKYTQQLGGKLPNYTLLEESGTEHEKIFMVQVDFICEDNQCRTASGQGPNKRSAEKSAAQCAMNLLRENFPHV